MDRKPLRNAIFALFCLIFSGGAVAEKTAPVKFQGDPLAQVRQLMEHGQLDEAEKRWRALQGQLDPVAWHYNLGVLLAEQGRTVEAAEQFEKALMARQPAATVWQALKKVRAFEARSAYAALFKDAPRPQLNLKLLPVRALDSRHAATIQAVADALEGWRRAWSAQDVDAYLRHYADDFRPVSGLSHEQWVAQRRVRLTRPRFIEVTLSDLRIEPVSDDRVITTFRQRYRSNLIDDTVRKRLVWHRRDGRWVIVQERVVR